MKVLSFLPLIVSLASWTASVGASGLVDSPNDLEAREWVDALSLGLETREVEAMYERQELLEQFTARELLDELHDRLERRGNVVSSGGKGKKFKCPYCGRTYSTFQAAKDCSTGGGGGMPCKAK